MASVWMWLSVSLAVAAAQVWGTKPSVSDSTAQTNGPQVRLTCTPGGDATFTEVSSLGGISTPEHQGGSNSAWSPPAPQHDQRQLTLQHGTDPGWVGEWREQAAHGSASRDCNVLVTTADGQTVLHAVLHHASPSVLERKERAVSKLVLDFEAIDVAP